MQGFIFSLVEAFDQGLVFLPSRRDLEKKQTNKMDAGFLMILLSSLRTRSWRPKWRRLAICIFS